VFRLTLKETALAGLIAAAYALLGLFFAPISFAVYQIRVAEALTVLPFLSRAAIPGLFAGCAITNVLGSQGWPDVVFGSLLTLVAAMLTRLTRRVSRAQLGWYGATLPVAVIWLGALILLNHTSIDWPAAVSGAVAAPFAVLAVRLWLAPHWGNGLAIGAGLVSMAWLAAALLRSNWSAEDNWSPIIGVVALVVAWLLTMLLTWLWVRGDNPNILLAPLPPVVINAFGVAAYVAPMYELPYWPSVLSIGVGQLIACYALGLPLLKLLQKRVERLLPER
jgi:uncharacterized membrane protein